jgi:hypothetical protein
METITTKITIIITIKIITIIKTLEVIMDRTMIRTRATMPGIYWNSQKATRMTGRETTSG